MTGTLGLLFLFILVGNMMVVSRCAIGVNWGLMSSHKLPHSIVVDLLKANKIQKVKLFESDTRVLDVLAGSEIQVMMGIPNELLLPLSSSPAAADLWVRQNISRFAVKGGVDIRYVAVGNEPFLSSYAGAYQSLVLPALQNIQNSLVKANLAGTIKPVVPCNSDAYQSSLPSQGSFRPEITQIMTQLVSFLSSIGSPFIVNIYPFLSLYDSSDFPQEYAFFEGTARPLVDGQNMYYNAFDGNFDTLVAALYKIGYGQMQIVVGEVGWPTDGAFSANLTAAKVFNQGLINHVLSNKGTPLRPGVPPLDIYLFSLLDEDLKSINPGNFERHWGIFSFDGQAKYPLSLGSGTGLLRSAKYVQYLPSRWCIADPSSDMNSISGHMQLACNEADCTTLFYGGACNTLGNAGNVSYAFNSFYQSKKQDPESCYFGGNGMITFLDPSIGDCRFLVGISDNASCKVLSLQGRIWMNLLTFMLLGIIIFM